MSKLKLIALVAALVLALPAALFAAPQAGDIVFTVGQTAYQYDGEAISMSTAPVIIDGHAYLPVRDVAQALGFGVAWDPAARTITLDKKSSDTVISGTVGDSLPVVVSVGKGEKLNGIIDTGSTISGFPESYLHSLGYSPISSNTILMASGQATTDLYKIPYPTIWSNGVATPLGSGYLDVLGLPNTGQVLIGLDILLRDNLILHNGTWSLTVSSGQKVN